MVLKAVRIVEVRATIMTTLCISWVVSLWRTMLSQRVEQLQMHWRVQTYQQIFSQRVWLIHLNCLRVSLFFQFSLAFVSRNISQKLVSNARLYMKKASWGCCVSVFDSTADPAALPGIGGFAVSGGFGTEFEVGRTTPCDEGAKNKIFPRTDLLSSMC